MNTTNLQKYALRKRIDGMNFTLTKFFPELEEVNNVDIKVAKSQLLLEMVSKLSSTLSKSIEIPNVQNGKVVLDLNNELGIYSELSFRESDLILIFQLKGSFFTRDDAFILSRSLMSKLCSQFDGVFRLTRIDVAQDFLLEVLDVLPIPSECPPQIKYCFKYKSRTNTYQAGSSDVVSGFEMFAGRYSLVVYNKVLENMRVKNNEKKDYYEKIFSKYKGQPVTRVELKLKQEACKKLIEIFYKPNIEESEFLQLCSSQFFKRKKLRIRNSNSHDNDWRRWPVHPHWSALFDSCTSSCLDEITSPDYRYTTPKKNIEKALFNLVDTLSANYPEIDFDQLREKVESINLREIYINSRNRFLLKKRTDEKFKLFKDEIVNEYLRSSSEQQPPVVAEGNSGDYITSPLESMVPEKSNTCEASYES